MVRAAMEEPQHQKAGGASRLRIIGTGTSRFLRCATQEHAWRSLTISVARR